MRLKLGAVFRATSIWYVNNVDCNNYTSRGHGCGNYSELVLSRARAETGA